MQQAATTDDVPGDELARDQRSGEPVDDETSTQAVASQPSCGMAPRHVRQIMIKRVIVRFRAGPTWESGGAIREQVGWDDHAAFINELVERRMLVMAGPYSDNSGAMILLEGIDAVEAEQIVARDPFVENGVLHLEEIREWTIFRGCVQA